MTRDKISAAEVIATMFDGVERPRYTNRCYIPKWVQTEIRERIEELERQAFLGGARAMQEAAVSAALNCEVTLTGDDPFGNEQLAAAIRALDPEKVGQP